MSNRTIRIYMITHDTPGGRIVGFYPTKKEARDAAVSHFERTGLHPCWTTLPMADNSTAIAAALNSTLAMVGYQ